MPSPKGVNEEDWEKGCLEHFVRIPWYRAKVHVHGNMRTNEVAEAFRFLGVNVTTDRLEELAKTVPSGPVVVDGETYWLPSEVLYVFRELEAEAHNADG